MSGEEMASPSLTEWPVYAFNGNKSKGASDDIDPFAIRNLLQDLDLSKYGYDVMVAPNLVKDVSVASRVREVLMCHDGKGQYINVPDVDAPTSEGPFKPYRDVVLDKSQVQISMKHFLPSLEDCDYAHDQFSAEEGVTEKEIDDQFSTEKEINGQFSTEVGTEKEREVVVEHTNTAVESTYREDNVNNIYSDVEVGKTHDTGDESGRKVAVNGTSEFSTDRVFKSRKELTDWVQNVGRSLGYIIITKRSSTYNSRGGVTCKVTLMCDHCGIYDSQSSQMNSKLTKNINCPFKLVGETSNLGSDSWILRVICEEHNHEPAGVHVIKSHPFAMRLSDNETRLVLDLSRKNVKPQVILMILKKLNPNNISNISTIYNTRHKFRNAGEKFSGEEMASLGPTECPVDAFDANKGKEASDNHTDPFAIRNVLQDLDLSKYGYTDMMVTNLVKDLSVTSRVKDVSVASRVEEVLMCHNVGAFKPYRDIVLDKSQGQFSMTQLLDSDTAVESTDGEDDVNNVCSDKDVAVDKKLDTRDENERNFAVNGTSEFSTDRVFKSRQELTDWAQNVGRSLGYVVITKRSSTYNSSGGVMCKVTLMCDRCGIYKSQSSHRHPKLSKKTNCPFKLVGNNSKCSKFWTLKVICEEHNHEPAPVHMKGHPYAMRLSDNETRLVLDLTKKNVKPHVILMILKKLNPNNMSTLQTVYNMRQKLRNAGEKISGEDMASLSPTECPKYVFNANGASDDTDPFALRNLLQDLDLSKYGYDILVTPNLVKDVSVASRVKDMLMCHDGNGQDKIITYADASTSAGPFRSYRVVVLDKSQRQISMKHFLDSDYAHEQLLSEEGVTEKGEGVVEHHMNTDEEDNINNLCCDVEVEKKCDNINNVCCDVEVKKKHDTGDEIERKFAVNGTSEFSTDRVFKSRQELTDWVQNVGLSLGSVADKSQGQFSMKQYLGGDFAHDQFLLEDGETEKERETFVVHHSNNEDRTSPSPLYTAYSSDANKSKRTNIEENASSSTTYAFDSRAPKRSIDQVYRFDFRNVVQGVDSTECESVIEDFVFQTKQKLMPSSFERSFPPHVDIMMTNNGDGLCLFQPNQEVVSNMPQREILKKRLLDRDYAREKGVAEHHTNTAVDLTYSEDKVNYVFSDVAVNTTCDKSERKLAVNGTSDYFPQRDEGYTHSRSLTA
ncbi:uncharacterized protein [Rutidosis leptorrhynchoides]|uniref:uncharacterized protein n=1 Tax=Rutidosis leptorrhynchoides TaxID=125765 RepID=UPI003A9A192E